jgi:hypothetical protein
VKVHRILSWLLAFFSLSTILTGYATARKWIQNFYFMSNIHKVLEWIFLVILIAHIWLTSKFFKINCDKVLSKSRNRSIRRYNVLKISQRITAWLILIVTIIVVLSGFNNYRWFAQTLGRLSLFAFSNHRIADGALTGLIVMHTGLGLIAVLIRNRKAKPKFLIPTIFLVVTLLGGIGILEYKGYSNGPGQIINPESAVIQIGAEIYSFNPQEIISIRSNIFREGVFSVFDILLFLENQSKITLQYHFDPEMNTYVIDSMNGQTYWWYEIYYSGGWSEDNAFRMDHYPWKEGATIRFRYSNSYLLNRIHETFRNEISRLNGNNGTIIIPEIRIIGKDDDTRFYDIEVTSHNFRDDLFQEGVVTGIDAILSLKDQGLIDSYDLQWYDEIGTAKIVRNYWINGINDDVAYGTCGFVYEFGDHEFDGFSGNHIHLPSDARVLNSPEYGLWYWICL